MFDRSTQVFSRTAVSRDIRPPQITILKLLRSIVPALTFDVRRSVQATKVLNALVQYVKAEQKDRVHTINHYERVEESDPIEAESQRASVAAHLRGIDERVTQAIEMLSRLPKYEKKIRQQIGENRPLMFSIELYQTLEGARVTAVSRTSLPKLYYP